MDNYGTLIAETEHLHKQRIENHPLIHSVLSGGVQHEHYVVYLRETYHMVRHTSRMLSLAGGRLDDDRRALRDWFFEEVREENNHDQLCIRDLKNLGEEVEEVLSVPPGPGAWGLITQNYYMATYGNPVGILGVASLTEGLGAAQGDIMADTLMEQYGFQRNQVNFIKSHARFDERHIEDVKHAVNEFVATESEFAQVVHGRQMTIHHYSQMFDDVLSKV